MTSRRWVTRSTHASGVSELGCAARQTALMTGRVVSGRPTLVCWAPGHHRRAAAATRRRIRRADLECASASFSWTRDKIASRQRPYRRRPTTRVLRYRQSVPPEATAAAWRAMTPPAPSMARRSSTIATTPRPAYPQMDSPETWSTRPAAASCRAVRRKIVRPTMTQMITRLMDVPMARW